MAFKQGFADQFSFKRTTDGVSAFDLTNLLVTLIGLFASFNAGKFLHRHLGFCKNTNFLRRKGGTTSISSNETGISNKQNERKESSSEKTRTSDSDGSVNTTDQPELKAQ